jgi:hypothetical protein
MSSHPQKRPSGGASARRPPVRSLLLTLVALAMVVAAVVFVSPEPTEDPSDEPELAEEPEPDGEPDPDDPEPAPEEPEPEPSPDLDTLGPFPAADLDTSRFDVTLSVNPAELSVEQLHGALDLAQAVDVTQIEAPATWWYLNRGREPRDYDWSDLDELMDAAVERGLRVVLGLTGTPGWVHGREQEGETSPVEDVWRPPVADDEQLDHWGDFVEDVVERYADRTAFFELWNEPNSEGFWLPEPDPGEFASLLRAGYLRAKNVDPDVVIASGGLSRNDIGYLETLYATMREMYPDAVDNGHFFDIFGVHPYSRDNSPSSTSEDRVRDTTFGLVDENFLGFTRMYEVLEREGEGNKPVYLGEYGFSTTETWMDPVDDQTRADYLQEAYAIASEYPYIVGLAWYDFLTYNGNAPWAIVDAEGRPGATFEALGQVETS